MKQETSARSEEDDEESSNRRGWHRRSDCGVSAQQKGIDVTVFDAGVGQATKAAAGIICPWLSQRRNKDWYQLVSHGAAYYPQLMDQLRADGVSELPYEQVGAYIFKHTEKQLAKVEEMAVERRVDAPMMARCGP